MDNILTSFRRESNAFAIDSSNYPYLHKGSPSNAEYVKAAAAWFPELEIFEFV
jgi:hypothetical protein